MPTVLVVGGQWGDEGKGKIVDLLSAEACHVIRAQGGANAGHTVIVGTKEYKLHLIPSGILHPHTQCYIGAGVVVDAAVMLSEIVQLESEGIEVRGRLWLSARAHLVLPFHRLIDALSEKAKGASAIGTTGRGIGPCYADRVDRTGLRVGDLLDVEQLRERLRSVLDFKNQQITELYGGEALSFEAVYAELCGYAEKFVPFVADVEHRMIQACQKGEKLLLEGAQGTLLDTSFGTYPFVTSSSTTAGGICVGAGLAPKHLDYTLAIMKAYCTRVGQGPFPTEDRSMIGADHATVREIGTTTGRKRRIGWFDGVLARWAVDLNGADALAITKLDILDELERIQVCVGYRLEGQRIDAVPASAYDLARVEPIYETVPGWRVPTHDAKTFEDLPSQAKDYLHFLSELSGAAIGMVSVGPERTQTFVLSPPFGS